MYKVQTVNNYGTETLILIGIDRLKRVVDSQKTNLLTTKLIDTLEVKNLEWDLANEEEYQLIGEVNEAEFYNQVKS